MRPTDRRGDRKASHYPVAKLLSYTVHVLGSLATLQKRRGLRPRLTSSFPPEWVCLWVHVWSNAHKLVVTSPDTQFTWLGDLIRRGSVKLMILTIQTCATSSRHPADGRTTELMILAIPAHVDATLNPHSLIYADDPPRSDVKRCARRCCGPLVLKFTVDRAWSAYTSRPLRVSCAETEFNII